MPRGAGLDILSTKATSLAVRPPTLLNELATPLAAPAMAGPAEDETLDRPSWALEAYSEAVAVALDRPSWALVAYSEVVEEALEEALAAPSFAVSAAFDVVDSNRRAAMRLQAPDCRSMGRAREGDMVARVFIDRAGSRRAMAGTRRKERKGSGEVGGGWWSSIAAALSSTIRLAIKKHSNDSGTRSSSTWSAKLPQKIPQLFSGKTRSDLEPPCALRVIDQSGAL